MKYLIVLLALTGASPLMAAEVIIAISPYQTKDAVTAQLQWLNAGFSKLDGGTNVQILDANTAHEIARFTIPQNASHRHTKALMARYKRHYRRIAYHVMKTPQKGHVPASGDLPRLINHLADYQNETKQLWLLVSPIFDQADAAPFSMSGGKVASDGLIAAGYPQSPFGTEKRNGALKNLSVHWWMPQSMPNAVYAMAVRRMWHLYLDGFGASLVSFTADHTLMMQRAIDKAKALPLRDILKPEDGLRMMRVSTITPEQALFSAPVSDAPLQVQGHSTMSVGIQWDAPVDLDLLVWPAPDAEMIYFAQQRTDYGIHYKDIQTGSASANTQYETIDVTTPVDLGTVEIVINYYGGNSAEDDISGTLRMAIAGQQVYAAPFAVSAHEGNKGKDIERVLRTGRPSSHTLRFKPADITDMSLQGATL